MLENATYSIISPEGFASIIYKDSKKAAEAAELMKLTADDLDKLNIIEKIIEEPEEFTTKNMDTTVDNIKLYINSFLEKHTSISKEDLVESRYTRFRNM